MKNKKQRLSSKDIQDAFDGNLGKNRKAELDNFALQALDGMEYIKDIEDLESISNQARLQFQKNKTKRKPSIIGIFLKVAAVLIGIYVITRFSPFQENTSSYVTERIEKIPCAHPLCDTREVNTTQLNQLDNNQLKLAFGFFQEEKFTQSSKHFNKYLAQNKEASNIIFYAAISLMKSDQKKEAIKSFNVLLSSAHQILPPQLNYTKWYLSLCYLDTKQKEKALPLLVQLEKSENQFKSDARQLLFDLNYFKL